MEVSSSTQETSGVGQVDIIKKAQEVQEKQLTELIASTTEESQQVTAQKTGMGNSINITG